MLQIHVDLDDPYVPFGERRERPWWAYDPEARASAAGVLQASRRLVGHALIRLGRAVAAESRVPAAG